MPHIDSGGVSIYVEQHGTSGDPLVLLMGLGVDAHGWEFQLPAFAAKHRVLVIDNRGIGRSAKPAGPYTVALLADDAAAAMAATGFSRAHVVGISMGGMIAQELALRHPDRVASLVLAATYARPGRDIHETSARGSQSIAGSSSPLELITRSGMDLTQLDPRAVFGFLMPLVLSDEYRREKNDWLRAFFERSLGYGFNIPAFLGQVAAVMTHDTTERLHELRAPTLVITGDADRLVPAHHSDELGRLIPHAKLVVVEGGTHGFNFERADEFNRIVLDFLAEHPIDAGASGVAS